MAASAPYQYTATLQYPPDIGAPNVQIPITNNGTFESESTAVYKLTGAGTQVVDFGTITPNGAKLISIEVDPDSSPAAQPSRWRSTGPQPGLSSSRLAAS